MKPEQIEYVVLLGPRVFAKAPAFRESSMAGLAFERLSTMAGLLMGPEIACRTAHLAESTPRSSVPLHARPAIVRTGTSL